MTVFLKHSRAAVLIILCAFLAACSQTTTGVSSYGGKLGHSKQLTKNQRQAKKLAARKKSKAKRIAAQQAFVAKRQARRDARRAKLSGKKSLVKSRKVTKRLKKKRRLKRNAKRKTKRTLFSKRNTKRIKKRSRKIARAKTKAKNKLRKLRKIKKSSYAYVGGRSKGIRRKGAWRCVPRKLKRVISQISRKFGRVTINSTHRSRGRNRRVGGKRRSYHLRCRAIDFRVHGRTRGLTRWLSRHPSVGGYKRYRSGYYHIDNGPRRTW